MLPQRDATDYLSVRGDLDVYNFGTPAPVDWLSFTATPDKAEVDLDWATAHEENTDYFGIERQEVGGNWVEIGRVTAVGFASSETSYDFTDNNPGPTDPIYYRLRQVDFDGSVDYSLIVSVAFPNSETAVSIYPNPATRSIFLSGKIPSRRYRIADVNGRIILIGTLADLR